MSTVNVDVAAGTWVKVADAGEQFAIRQLSPHIGYGELAAVAADATPPEALEGFPVHDVGRAIVRTDVGAGHVFYRCDRPARIVINTWAE